MSWFISFSSPLALGLKCGHPTSLLRQQGRQQASKHLPLGTLSRDLQGCTCTYG
ncbi:hypothetical protein BAE44_0022873 [Dichanthelium oligosanthes]|uniref:Uncharacterized protein n=1 Tax=Dichanthelium oligosanthes TaxID=888268 RepID=A0A1E5UTF5_9POAL|nr:hypothetical protein BAE44_0022873 [Dichanthelium oligosanthes]